MGRSEKAYRKKLITFANTTTPEARAAAIRKTMGKKAYKKVLELRQRRLDVAEGVEKRWLV